MRVEALVTLGYGLLSGLFWGTLLLPVGRWLGKGYRGKLVALACGVFGCFAATFIAMLLKVPMLYFFLLVSFNGSGLTPEAEAAWFIGGILLSILAMLLYRRLFLARRARPDTSSAKLP